MKKPSLKDRILKYIRKEYPNWVHGGTIETLSGQAGFKASNGSRRCREMASGKTSTGQQCEILLEKKENEKGQVMYRATKPRLVEQYRIETGQVIIRNLW